MRQKIHDNQNSRWRQQWILASLLILIMPFQSIQADQGASGEVGVSGVSGYWVVPGKDAVIRIDHENGRLSLNIVRTLDPDLLDSNNPDKSQHAMPLAGTILGYGFKEKGDGWSGGEIYDPVSGKHYNASLNLIDKNHLKVRGYIGLPVLGRSQIWVRLASFRIAMTDFLTQEPQERSTL